MLKKIIPLYLSLSACLFSTAFPLFAATYEYELSWLAPNSHTYLIALTAEVQSSEYTDFKIPAWRPGRYILQDYAGAISHFRAYGLDGKPLAWKKIDKDTWRVTNQGLKKVKVTYRYFANNVDAGSSYLGNGEIYFNPINIFMYIDGRLDDPAQLNVPTLPPNWKVATALKRNGNVFSANSYHDFADSPTVFSNQMKQLSFDIDGVKFYLHFHGRYEGGADTDRAILDNVERICKEQAAIFGEFPFEEYHFIYRLLPYNMRHAVEHKYSSSFALPSSVTRSPRAANSGICGITAHEFWHVWNVKRIRPAALFPYDYSKPQYTGLHWFTEGVTDYYTNLTLVRTGIISHEDFVKRLGNTVSSLENNYAASVISPDQASFDSWLSSSPYAHPHHRISYYTLGSRMGMLLDLAIRNESNGKSTLDDVFRYLYQNYYQKELGVPERGIQEAMEALTQSSWEDFFQKYIYDTQSIDYKSILKPFGLILDIEEENDAGAKMLGINRYNKISQGIMVTSIYPGSDAYNGGLGEEMIILSINDEPAADLDLDEYVNKLEEGDVLQMKVFRDGEVVDMKITFKGENRPKKYSLSLSKKKNKNFQHWVMSVIEEN